MIRHFGSRSILRADEEFIKTYLKDNYRRKQIVTEKTRYEYSFPYTVNTVDVENME